MDMLSGILLLAVMISFVILVMTFGFYGLFLLIFSKKTMNQTLDEQVFTYPRISIVLPTFNEGEFIQKKVSNLLETHYKKDKIEIIIADDSSDKESIEITKNLTKNIPQVHLCKSDQRRGYSQALIDAFNIATGDIIIITDCGSLYDEKTLCELVHPLKNSKIGGVTGAANILNLDETSGKSESFYRKIYNFMRQSESNADSTFHFHGEASSVKRKLLSNLQSFDNLDIAIAFHIRKKGYRVIFNDKANFYEHSPDSLKGRYKQKLLRATGLIKVILSNKSCFSPKYGLFGTIIYPAHISMMIICPLMIALGSISSIFLLLIYKDLWFLFICFLLFLGLSYLVKKEVVINFVQFEFVLLIAIWKAFTDKSKVLYIEKIESTRR